MFRYIKQVFGRFDGSLVFNSGGYINNCVSLNNWPCQARPTI